MRAALAVLIVVLLACTAAVARENRKTLRFERGADSATVQGAVIRGDRDVYDLGARAGQTMEVSVTAFEDNAVFQVFAPGGKPLPGADEGDDAKAWKGALPASGTYRIVVGGTRGNAEYALTVSIR
ncbi:hypothetical protein NNJEOMEG_00867 [Fundidesulfovibrio magnetotacticus]|uniref:Uncharacterized protein n=1 Tax=Fundidesulfovibrio magnetotacticus TaxID=2730080 RepID=A0A6V8LRS4_9BACT|nr:hypothetical protein [Fundidesulfovibrio magnetotacticus]GFK93038.1 hypothetical protein NNJEOMEG_00867 [Fundidesulfovibrio magnetotacticus]